MFFHRNNYNGMNGYGGYNNGGSWRGRFSNMRQRMPFNNGMRPGGSGAGWITLFLILAICGVVYLKNSGSLGHWKNRLLATPQEQRAAMNKGITQAQQANKNVANEELVKRGDKDAANNIIHDKVLLKDQFSYLPDAFNMPGKVYSIFVFSNSKDYDAKWESAIKDARNKTLKVYTTNGRDIQNSDDTFFFDYFNRNYAVPQSNKNYGKIDGVPHPFIVLIVNHVPKKIITLPKDEKNLFDYQLKIQNILDKKANNYNLPDQPIGLKNPRWGKYAKYVKNKATQTYNDVTNKKNTTNANSNSSSASSHSNNDQTVGQQQQNNNDGKSLSQEILGH